MRIFICCVSLILLCNRCANIKNPTGGPKDKTPPKVVSSVPNPKQVNFKSPTVEVLFNESIKLNNPREEIIISPSPGKDIEFKLKGTKLMITPQVKWRDSTTYSILFREGIKDITEGNSPANLKLAFSTGPYIDSLSLSGTVVDLLNGIPMDKITVAIYTSDTFNIFTDTPGFFTKTGKQGRFLLDNLKAGTYKIYAFDDKNKNLKVESRAEMFGFLATQLNLQHNIDTLNIGLIRLDSRPFTMSSIRNIGNITRLRFSKNVFSYTIASEPKVAHAFSDSQSEINLWNPTGDDSVKLHLSAVDSLQNTLDTAFYIKRTAVRPVRERFTWSIGNPSVNPETSRLITVMKFSKPLSDIRVDSLYVEIDTLNKVHFAMEDLSYDQQRREISITKEMNKKLFGADQDPRLRVIVRPGFAISMDDDTTKVLSAPILIYWPEENGTLSIQAITKEKYYLLQVLDNTRKVVVQAVNTPKLTARNIPPSEYQIRIIIDQNMNGRWDAGNFDKGVEPEKIIFYKGEGGVSNLPIRANWELGPIVVRF